MGEPEVESGNPPGMDNVAGSGGTGGMPLDITFVRDPFEPSEPPLFTLAVDALGVVELSRCPLVTFPFPSW